MNGVDGKALRDTIRGSLMREPDGSAVAQWVRFLMGRIRNFAPAIPLLAALIGAGLCGRGQLNAQAGPGLECIEQMTLPVYAGLVWQAQVVGVATVRLVVSWDGSASEVTIESPHKTLTAWVAGALRSARFRRECKGQAVVLTFKYSLQGEKRAAPDNQITVRHPGIVEIRAHPPVLRETVD